MYATGGAGPDGVAPVRRFEIGATVVADQIVCARTNDNGFLGDPASVNDYSEAVGVTLEAGTYATSTDVAVWCYYLPFQVYRGVTSNGATAGTALGDGTDEQILTQDTASTTVLTDTAVGTTEFVGGLQIGLTGDNAGITRRITSHSDNTSQTVNKAYPDSIAVGDTVVRTYGDGQQGGELTSNYVEFNMKPGGGTDIPDTGNAAIRNIWFFGQKVQADGLGDTRLRVDDATAPYVEVEFVLADHYLNTIA